MRSVASHLPDVGLQRLRFERARRGWTQAALARAAGLSQPLVCLIESGRYDPTPDELTTLADALGIQPPQVLLKEIIVVDPEEVGA